MTKPKYKVWDKVVLKTRKWDLIYTKINSLWNNWDSYTCDNATLWMLWYEDENTKLNHIVRLASQQEIDMYFA